MHLKNQVQTSTSSTRLVALLIKYPPAVLSYSAKLLFLSCACLLFAKVVSLHRFLVNT